MITTHDITQYARHMFSRSRGYPDKHLMHPQREWIIIVSLFVVVFMVGVGTAWYQLQVLTNVPDTITPNTERTIPSYNDRLVERVHTNYEARAERFDEFLATTTVPVATSSSTTASTTPTPFDAATSTPATTNAPASTEAGGTTDASVATTSETNSFELDPRGF